VLVVDDILLFPVRSLLFIFKEIHQAALEELRLQAEHIRQELSALYLKLESGQISESEFEEREAILLDRLDELEAVEEEAEVEEEEEAEVDENPETGEAPQEM
jgi:hypothetical protein